MDQILPRPRSGKTTSNENFHAEKKIAEVFTVWSTVVVSHGSSIIMLYESCSAPWRASMTQLVCCQLQNLC